MLSNLRPVFFINVVVLCNLGFCNLVPLVLDYGFSPVNSLIYLSSYLFIGKYYLFFKVYNYFSLRSLIFYNSLIWINTKIPFFMYPLPISCSPRGYLITTVHIFDLGHPVFLHYLKSIVIKWYNYRKLYLPFIHFWIFYWYEVCTSLFTLPHTLPLRNCLHQHPLR